MRKRLFVAIGASALVTMGIQPALAAPAADAPTPAVSLALAGDWTSGIRGGDLVGLEKAYRLHGGHETLLWQVSGVGRPLGTAEAQEIMDAHTGSIGTSPTGPIAAAIPTDAFSVAVTAFKVEGTNTVLVQGSWNFRDNYVGSGGGPDIATVTARALSGYCAQVSRTVSHTYNYQNTETGRSSLRNSGVTTLAPTLNVNDATSGFVLATDNGVMGTYYDRTSASCHAGVQADFHFEHNQGGGGVLNVSVAWGALSVSYTGSGESSLQKAANPVSAHW